MYFAHWTLTTPDGRTIHVSTPDEALLNRLSAKQAFSFLLPKSFVSWDEARSAGWSLQPRLAKATHQVSAPSAPKPMTRRVIATPAPPDETKMVGPVGDGGPQSGSSGAPAILGGRYVDD